MQKMEKVIPMDMKNFEIEHIGITVVEPIEMAKWYQEVLGFNIIFSAQDGEKGVAFLSDCNKRVMLEFGKVPDVSPLTDRINHHLQLHIAFKSEEPDKDAEYLVSKGATFIEKCPITLPGEYLVVLSDPWGNTIQLVKRVVVSSG
jgi:catechol-2,3-dioxygenase